MNALPTCSIRATNLRALLWVRVFGRLGKIPIQRWLPTRANLPHQRNAEVYMLDLKRITPEERERLIIVIAVRFNLTTREVEADLKARGCPILGEDLLFDIPLRQII